MNKQQGGALAAAGVVAVGAGHYAESGGHVLPEFIEGTSHVYMAPSGHKYEVPEWVHKAGEHAIEHCLRELDAGEDCTHP